MTKAPITWIPVVGQCEITKGVLKYTPDIIADGENAGAPRVALVKSNQSFESGTIEVRAKLRDPDAKVQIGLSSGHRIETFVGINVGGAAYGMATFSNGKWENFTTAAYGSTPPLNREVRLRIGVVGSSVTMWVDGVEVLRGTYPIKRSQLAILLRGSETVEAELLSVAATPSVAFIVMQYTPEFDALYSEVIAPVCKEFGLSPVRADDIYNNGQIVDDIARSIREAALVIADITPENANVYYEVGYAHGIAKETVLLAERRREKERLPFDLSGFRTIFYDNTIGGKSMVEEKLRKHLQNALAK